MHDQPKQFALDISQTPKPSLSNFIEPSISAGATGSLTLLETLREVVRHWQTRTSLPLALSWIYCWGATGSGKTHLIEALKDQALHCRADTVVLQHGSSAAWQALNEKLSQKRQLPQVCLVDGVDLLDADEQNVLFRLQLESKDQADVFLFCAGSSSALTLNLREDIRSRLSWGLNFELSVLSDDQKMEALHQAARERGISLSADVPAWLLNHFHRDLPSLLSLIEALDHFSLEKKRAITLPLLREFLKSLESS